LVVDQHVAGAHSSTSQPTGRDQAEKGLSAAEVAERVARGQTNDVPARTSRTFGEIVRANVLTRINLLLGVLLVIVLAAGSVIDGMFGLLIIANSGVGIVQEVRAKRTLDRLAILNRARPLVRRDGATRERAPAEVVLDDIIELGPGDQVVVDGVVIASDGLELDESLLTGEADPIAKDIGATALSGSLVAGGSGAYRATKVGRDAYAARLTAEASRFTLVRSELRAGIDRILALVTYLIIPAGLLTIYNQLFLSGEELKPALVGMVAALVPMVPEGLVLMTSIAFAVGVIRLGRRQCLVQELPAIEGLARVDVLCLDKTGTLTETGMRLRELIPVTTGSEARARAALAALVAGEARPNASILAIKNALPDEPGWGKPTAIAPFTSAKKWSGMSFGENGHWLLGAADMLLEPSSEEARTAEALGAKGLRVLLLARSDRPVDDAAAPGNVAPEALVVLEQRVRPDARATLDYFADVKVDLKVISGDNAASVGAIATTLGLAAGEPVDARDLPKESAALGEVLETATVLGRVRPEQKREMVRALQSRGHTVAMTGDGINDLPALKQADIGIAMGSGSAATRAVAQVVLLDNRFATLPSVVAEGRRVVGNIERVANLFLTKTVYAALLAFLIGATGIVGPLLHFDPLPYPFLPRHVTIAGWFTIGIPAFVLSLAPNYELARAHFVSRVVRLAVPSGIIVGLATFICYAVVFAGPDQTDAEKMQAGTAALITLIIVMLWVLAIVARPYQWWKLVLIWGSALAYVAMFALPAAREFFALDVSDAGKVTTALVCAGVGVVVLELSWRLIGWRSGERVR